MHIRQREYLDLVSDAFSTEDHFVERLAFKWNLCAIGMHRAPTNVPDRKALTVIGQFHIGVLSPVFFELQCNSGDAHDYAMAVLCAYFFRMHSAKNAFGQQGGYPRGRPCLDSVGTSMELGSKNERAADAALK